MKKAIVAALLLLGAAGCKENTAPKAEINTGIQVEEILTEEILTEEILVEDIIFEEIKVNPIEVNPIR